MDVNSKPPEELARYARDWLISSEAWESGVLLKENEYELSSALFVRSLRGKDWYWRFWIRSNFSKNEVGWVDVTNTPSLSVVRKGLSTSDTMDTLKMKQSQVEAMALEFVGNHAKMLVSPEPIFLESPTKTAWYCTVQNERGVTAELLVTPKQCIELPNARSNAKLHFE